MLRERENENFVFVRLIIVFVSFSNGETELLKFVYCADRMNNISNRVFVTIVVSAQQDAIRTDHKAVM